MIGISTNCLADVSLEKALEVLSGMTGTVEIMDDGLHFMETAGTAECFSLDFFVHAPCRGVNLASQLEPIRRASVEVISGSAEVASELGAMGIVVHPGYISHVMCRDAGVSALGKSLSGLREISDEYSVDFFFENMPRWDYFLLKEPGELPLIEDFGLALDVGHAKTNSCLDEFLKVPAAHFHLHDNDGKEDLHLAVGAGCIDFGPVLDAVGRSGSAGIIEANTLEGAKESLEYIRVHRPDLF